jgi:hypothetical protein
MNDDNLPGEYFFVKITNMGRRRVGVSHVWLDAGNGVAIPLLTRPLPAYLEPDDTVEVWLSVAEAPPEFRIGDSGLARFRVKLTAGKVFHSKQNHSVPSMGYVAGLGS